MSSYEDASKIVNVYAKQAEQTREEAKQLPTVKPPTQFSTGIKFSRGTQQQYLPLPKLEEGPIYQYVPPVIISDGPTPPPDFEQKGYVQHVRGETPVEKAGGYKSNISCLRALQEALQGLYHGS